MIAVINNRDFQEYVEQLLDRCECDDLEFKSASDGFSGSFWETYSAFANTDGGTILVGVAEKKGATDKPCGGGCADNNPQKHLLFASSRWLCYRTRHDVGGGGGLQF